MRIRLAIALLAATAALSATTAAPAQLSVEVKGPVPQGSTVFTYIEATASTQLRSACPEEIRAGSPTGPVVRGPGLCIALLVIVGPGNPYTRLGWDGKDSQRNNVAPGTYYMKIQHKPVNSTNPWRVHWVPVHITSTTPPIGPILSGVAMFRGQPFGLTITDVTNPGAQYWMAASFTTNTGFALGPLHVALDADPLFFLSFPNPNPGLFGGFQGTLGNTGTANAKMFIPAAAPLGLQVSFHCAVQLGLNLVLSNPLTRVAR